jgi:hypothetical protein
MEASALEALCIFVSTSSWMALFGVSLKQVGEEEEGWKGDDSHRISSR